MAAEGKETLAEDPAWRQKLQKRIDNERAEFQMEDCTGCRYIGGLGLYGAATYVAYVGIQRQRLRGAKTLLGATPAIITSSLLFTMGTLRLLRINPFSRSGKETGIDFIHDYLKKLTEVSALKKTSTDEPGGR